MFGRAFSSRDRAGKAKQTPKRSSASKQRLSELFDSQSREKSVGARAQSIAFVPAADHQPSRSKQPSLSGSIITVVVGADQRLFAAHEEILSRSPYFKDKIHKQFFNGNAKRIDLTEEEPVVFSAILEYLYRADYSPRLRQDKRSRAWYLEDTQEPTSPQKDGTSLIYHSRVGDDLLKDTAIYCAAGKYGLDELKRLALRKQGLRTGIPVAVILRSARYAYDNTPEHDSALRAHYLALIIRSRKVFKRSGTMQAEMEKGGAIFWDLFVALANHLDDLQSAVDTPKTI